MKHEMLNEIVEEIEAEFNQLAECLFGLAKAPSLEDIEVSFRQSMQRVGGKFIECYVKSRSFGYMRAFFDEQGPAASNSLEHR